MKNYTLLGIAVALCISLCASCSNDDDLSGYPKKDMEFKGADLQKVKEALQGEWYLMGAETPTELASSADMVSCNLPPSMIIKDNNIYINDTYGMEEGNWYDITWFEVAVQPHGTKMHAFFPKYENVELMGYVPYIPYSIKNGKLTIIGTSEDDAVSRREYLSLPPQR